MNIFQQFKNWITLTCKSSKNPGTCDKTPSTLKQPKNATNIVYKISMNIKDDGEQTFDINFPVEVSDEKNAMIISHMMYKLTNNLVQEFHDSIGKNKKRHRVIGMAIEMWKNLINNDYHGGGVVIPPTRVFSCTQ